MMRAPSVLSCGMCLTRTRASAIPHPVQEILLGRAPSWPYAPLPGTGMTPGAPRMRARVRKALTATLRACVRTAHSNIVAVRLRYTPRRRRHCVVVVVSNLVRSLCTASLARALLGVGLGRRLLLIPQLGRKSQGPSGFATLWRRRERRGL